MDPGLVNRALSLLHVFGFDNLNFPLDCPFSQIPPEFAAESNDSGVGGRSAMARCQELPHLA